MGSRKTAPRKVRHLTNPPLVAQGQAPSDAPKVVTASLVELALAANLDGEELSKFTEAQSRELQRLQILNVKRNVQGMTLDKPELDALLAVLDAHSDEWKTETARAILKHAAEGAMRPEALSQFALKLARMGIHQ